ncbi:hypothetical protein SLEP1_g48940 [Rubroshorea leprosula]|uniref:Uncharacterized protein n=1 Tax=Rubroshorea leprosula TaxID=152421 RepID=A0AAV5LW31_9ROSI|nr:hypothetical protein SLEP1_g48940 [Rubroshorea leprosula]
MQTRGAVVPCVVAEKTFKLFLQCDSSPSSPTKSRGGTSGAEQGARAQAGAGARLGRAGDLGSGRRAHGAGWFGAKKQI